MFNPTLRVWDKSKTMFDGLLCLNMFVGEFYDGRQFSPNGNTICN